MGVSSEDEEPLAMTLDYSAGSAFPLAEPLPFCGANKPHLQLHERSRCVGHIPVLQRKCFGEDGFELFHYIFIE